MQEKSHKAIVTDISKVVSQVYRVCVPKHGIVISEENVSKKIKLLMDRFIEMRKECPCG
jgi:hypothetical protein